LKDDGIKRENQQMKQEWCGLTIFYHDKPTKKTTEVMYLDTPVGLVKMNLTSEEKENVTEVYNTWLHDVYELVLKPSQKELNSKYFNKEEKEKMMKQTYQNGDNSS
jgi:oligoribonuclease NrnB/cAMP/cGMP phosphodiesterase (DHH superfamily)